MITVLCKKILRSINAEITVAQKPNQGTNPKWGSNSFWGSFFVSFLEKQKRKYYKQGATKINKSPLKIEKRLAGKYFLLQQQAVGSSFCLDAKRSKKIKDEGCTSPSSGSYDNRQCYCSFSMHNLLLPAFLSKQFYNSQKGQCEYDCYYGF